MKNTENQTQSDIALQIANALEEVKQEIYNF